MFKLRQVAGAFLHPEAVPPETPWDPGAGLAVGLLFWWGRGGVLMLASPERGRLNAQVIYSVREPSFAFSLEVLYEACMGERVVVRSFPRAQLGAAGLRRGPGGGAVGPPSAGRRLSSAADRGRW